jgi:hypothetical protein
MKYPLLLSIMLFSFLQTFAQKKACDTVYRAIDSLAEYPGGPEALIKFMDTEMKAAINDCYALDSSMITSMTIQLLIDKKGKVLDAVFDDVALSKNCRERMRKKLLGMKAWTPAQYNGKAVCSYYSWLVGGVLWEDQ